VNNALERSSPEALPTSDDLPPPNTRRWVVRRKAAVVTAVRAGRITLEEALQRYQLTEEDYRSWERAFEQHGQAGCAPAFSNIAGRGRRAAYGRAADPRLPGREIVAGAPGMRDDRRR
jgi:hypothetical protein